jgi:succinate-acetate transporter protein
MGKKKFKTSAQLFSSLSAIIIGYESGHFWIIFVFSRKQNSRENLMIIVTNRPQKNAIACYLRCWEIETLFTALKQRDSGLKIQESLTLSA